MSARTTPSARPCAHTAALADAAVCDLAGIVEQLGELIGGGNEEANALNGMRAVLMRTGAMVEMIAKSHGGGGWDHSAMHWLFGDELRQAMQALEPVAEAAMRARRERVLAEIAQDEGGAE